MDGGSIESPEVRESHSSGLGLGSGGWLRKLLANATACSADQAPYMTIRIPGSSLRSASPHTGFTLIQQAETSQACAEGCQCTGL